MSLNDVKRDDALEALAARVKLPAKTRARRYFRRVVDERRPRPDIEL
jgi:hypothetical protein